MAVLACASPLTATDAGRKISSHPPRCLPGPQPRPCVCHLSVAELNNWRAFVSTALAATLFGFGGVGAMPSIAELNRFGLAFGPAHRH